MTIVCYVIYILVHKYSVRFTVSNFDMGVHIIIKGSIQYYSQINLRMNAFILLNLQKEMTKDNLGKSLTLDLGQHIIKSTQRL